MQDKGERLNYDDGSGESFELPILRHANDELYVALRQPDTVPYIVAPNDATPEKIVEFLKPRMARIKELRHKMRRRLESGVSTRCTFQEGDVVYLMGRPFMIELLPLEGSAKLPRGSRGRATLKCTAQTDVSVVRLFVFRKTYDQAKSAFMPFARNVVTRNAQRMAAQLCERLAIGGSVPPVRMREMRGRFSRMDAGAIWLSDDIIGYPPDCLALAVYDALLPKSPLDAAESQAVLESYLPGWRAAREKLDTRAKPYSAQ